MANKNKIACDAGENILLMTDSYKFTHWKQYPPGIQAVFSYFESRGGMFPETVFFGLQYIIKRYMEGSVVTKEKIEEAEEIVALHLGDKKLFNREGWEHILKEHDGKLPLSIKAVPEGSVVRTHNALITVENTCEKCYWLTNYMETMLVQTWYPTTVATLSFNMKKLILKYLEETGTPELADFKLHDFGYRGVSSIESAGIGGAAHLVNFKGTDTVASLQVLKKYYNAPMAGFSIPAAEHSTITSWGRENEPKAMDNMLVQYPVGTVAVVSDSYNIYEASSKIWGEMLRDKVLKRDGTVVIRPDSGNPPEVVLKVISILGEKFGYTINAKNYKVLNEHIRIIQGDGIDFSMTNDILETLKNNGWSADNIAFGMGGALLQKLHRDTQKCAFKCSSVTVNNEERDVYKEPITDKGKNSKAGRLKLVIRNGEYETVTEKEPGKNELVEIFRNGRAIREYSLEQVRERAKLGLANAR